MPIYEYECPKCGRFEVLQKADERQLKAKPDCSEKSCPKKAVRVISAAAFHLKGTGWYKTDYASGGSSTAKPSGGAKSESSTGSSSDSSSTGSGSSESGDKKKAKGSGGGCGSGCGCH